MVFVAGGLRSGERTVLTASAVYQIEAEASPSRLRASETMALHPDHSVREPVDAFSAHVGTFHVRADAQGEPIGGLQVLPDCLDARGGDEIDAGMVLMMAALFLGRRCLLYTSDAADERSRVDLGGRRIFQKKKTKKTRA